MDSRDDGQMVGRKKNLMVAPKYVWMNLLQGHLINNKCPFLSQDTLFETEMVNCCVYLSDAEVGEVSGLLLKAVLYDAT